MIVPRTRALAVAVAVALAALPSAAAAQSPQDAESLIEQAKALRQAGDDLRRLRATT